MTQYKKRERTQNWNNQEKEYLLDLCRKDMRVIENRRLDAGLTAVKNKAWKIVHQKFSKRFGTDRTCNRLKEQWRRMKACARNEIVDYYNRLARFGLKIADRKKPSVFTFEVWDFMQEAKKALKSDPFDESKMQLELEKELEYCDDHSKLDDHEINDCFTPPQELCNVDIKEEDIDAFNDTYDDSEVLNGDNLGASPNQSHSSQHNVVQGLMSTPTIEQNDSLVQATKPTHIQPVFHLSNISTTLETLKTVCSKQSSSAGSYSAELHNDTNNKDNHLPKRIRSNSVSITTEEHRKYDSTAKPNPTKVRGSILSNSKITSSLEIHKFMDMQNKEHAMRMKILNVQLQMAKHNCDLMEINKAIALKRLEAIKRNRFSS